MSLLRTPSGYVDPWTRLPVDPSAFAPLPVTDPAPVIRRPATPDELARLEGDARRQIPAYPSHHELAVVRANREAARVARRDAARALREAERQTAREAKKAARPPKAPKVRADTRRPTRQRIPDEDVIATLRSTSGNVMRSGRLLGISGQSVRQRIGVLSRWGLLPEDVAAMVDGRRHR